METIPATQPCRIDEIKSTIDITPEMVREKRQKLNPNESTGHDNLYIIFSERTCWHDLSSTIHLVYKESLKGGAYRSWLLATITSFLKRQSGVHQATILPTSITPLRSKIMESIVRDAIVTHMVKHNLLSDDQPGFVPEGTFTLHGGLDQHDC